MIFKNYILNYKNDLIKSNRIVSQEVSIFIEMFTKIRSRCMDNRHEIRINLN